MSNVLPEVNPHANRLARAAREMGDVMRYLAAHDELESVQRRCGNSMYFDHCEAAVVAAVVSYCRPFKPSRSGGLASTKLDAAELDCIDKDPAHKALHDQLIKRRDTVIAHADWGQHHTELRESSASAAVRRESVPNYSGGIDTEAFMRLAEAVRGECLAKRYPLDTQSSKADATGPA